MAAPATAAALPKGWAGSHGVDLTSVSGRKTLSAVNPESNAPDEGEDGGGEARLRRALEHFQAALAEQSLKMTDVRRAIVRAALTYRGHFEVQDLVRELRAHGVNEASMATVYRVLPLLLETGLVQPTLLSGERHRYEVAFEREHHDHLVCTSCGKVIEFQFEPIERLQDELATKYDFELTSHFHELLGHCGDCRRKGGTIGSARPAQR
jgi:Fur family transcriptional regulator, ferric uptake regulator